MLQNLFGTGKIFASQYIREIMLQAIVDDRLDVVDASQQLMVHAHTIHALWVKRSTSNGSDSSVGRPHNSII